MLSVHTYAWVGIEFLKLGGVDSLNLRQKVSPAGELRSRFPCELHRCKLLRI